MPRLAVLAIAGLIALGAASTASGGPPRAVCSAVGDGCGNTCQLKPSGRCLNADLRNRDLRGRDLRFARITGDLSGADLSGADLTNATIKATLNGTKFNGAKLQGARLHGSTGRGADFRKADMRSAQLGFERVDGPVKLIAANFSEANLSNAWLAGATLTDSAFQHTDLAGANLDWTELDRADFSWAKLGEATLRSARGSDVVFAGAHMAKADLAQHAGERQTRLHRANLSFADLTAAHLSGVDLTGARLDRANLLDAIVTYALLGDANLSNASLASAHLSHSVLTGANFGGASLLRTHLTEAFLENARFEHAYFSETQLQGARARGAVLWPSNFDEDPGAVNALFIRVDFNIDATGSNGYCHGAADPRNLKITADSYDGTCSGKVTHSSVPWVRHHAYWTWDGNASKRNLEIVGSGFKDPPQSVLHGRADGNWGAFVVTSVTDLAAEPTGDRPVASPGGPLAVNLRHFKRYRGGYGWVDGYEMQVYGWLRRGY